MNELNLKNALMAQLSKIREPCSIAMRCPTDIVSMGLIEDVAIDNGHVRVTLCLTDPGCVHFRSLQAYIRDVLLELDAVNSVTVVQTLDKLWTPDRAGSAKAARR